MSKHADAIGYLRELEKEQNTGWFNMVCDLAIEIPGTQLDPNAIENLKAIYVGIASYLPQKKPTQSPTVVPQGATSIHLESVSGFTNFKKIQDTFHLKLDKQVSIIFGHNGSGKSSICDAFKILANQELPTRPLHNVRITGTQNVQFTYKFKSLPQGITWTERSGYGSQSTNIKYFDTTIATKSIRENIEPGTIVELSPFGLNVFDAVKGNTNKFREVLQKIRDEIAENLVVAIDQTKNSFIEFKNTFFSNLSENTLGQLSTNIESAEKFSQDDELKKSQEKLTELEKASSEEGQKLLASEIRDLEYLEKRITEIDKLFSEILVAETQEKIEQLNKKINEQKLLNEGLLPRQGTLEGFTNFLRQAKHFCNLETEKDQICPLCKRPNQKEQADLFKKYFDLLEGQIEKDITQLKTAIEKIKDKKSSLEVFSTEEINKNGAISAEAKHEIISQIGVIKSSIDVNFTVSKDALETIEKLRETAKAFLVLRLEKTSVFETATKGAEEIKKEKESLASVVSNLKYLSHAKANINSLKELQKLAKKKLYWDQNLPKFTPLLRKITDTEKLAYEDLVVSDFHKRLEAEYKSIAEKDMSAFGVVLTKRGSSTGVSVLARIGGKEISNILSEGEQRLHSLALFFAEIETSKHSIIIFDDPISSFDYDYISNYCSRLRDFILKHPNRQVVVLTHNWEFFVNLQTTLNRHNLNGKMSIQVMESCSSVADYSESIDVLKNEISATLAKAGEPTKSEKEQMAGRMRRLIESIVNTHVFNNERHQYKQKRSSDSEFQKFTKIVPLLTQEAIDLRDLFAKLSISEHDDPRNSYVNSDKAMFQTRFDKITAIEAAIVTRK